MKRLTLTFDNGPWSGPTEAVLDILAARSLKATFFVVGDRLKDPLARRAAERAKEEGHWIGNHTLTHGTPLGMREDLGHAEEEIGLTQVLLGNLAHPKRFFRPNGKGKLGPHLLSRAAADYLIHHRFTVVTWSNVPRDWEEPREEWPDRALAAMNDREWDLLVLHEHYLAPMMDSLPTFLDRVLANGATIVQDFPQACVRLREGVSTPDLESLVTG